LLRYSHPWLAAILNYWPAAVLLPTILGLIAMFVVVTHFWDHHDERPAGTCHPRPRRGHRADERLTA
jgi:hypothetical protein